MKTDYRCPHCQSYLVCDNHLILTIKSENGEKQGLLLMSINLGDYSHVNHPTLQFEAGEAVDFLCPVCHANLKVPEINDKLIRLIMLDEDGKRYDVFFSRIAGEHSTFRIDQENIIEQYGEDASGYHSYFTTELKKQMNLDK